LYVLAKKHEVYGRQITAKEKEKRLAHKNDGAEFKGTEGLITSIN